MSVTGDIAKKFGNGPDLRPEERARELTIAQLKLGLRQRIAATRGSVGVIAQHLQIRENTVSRWGSPKYNGMPTIWQILKIAELAGHSPAWLAWGDGPQYAHDAAAAFTLGETFEKHPGARELIEKFPKLTADDKSAVIRFALSLPNAPAAAAAGQEKLEINYDRRSIAMTPAIAHPRAVADRLRENEIEYGAPEAKPELVDRHDEIKEYTVERSERQGLQPIPKWLNLAAGPGCDLELCDEFLYFRELDDWKHVHSAEVRGESMVKTLLPGEVILMREFASGRFELPQIESKAEKTTLKDWMRESQIFHDDICVLSINGDAPTVKRIKYDTRRGALNWKMQIVADNPPAWGDTFQVATGDSVVFYAKLIGRKKGDVVF